METIRRMKEPRIFSIVLAAGASTRMKSSRSKLLHRLLGQEIIVHAYEQALKISEEPPVFVLGHQKDEIEKCLKNEFGESQFQSTIQDPPLGTGDAVRMAMKKIGGSIGDDDLIFIMGGDAVCLTQKSIDRLKSEHISKKAVLSFFTAFLNEPAAYGRVIRSGSGMVNRIVEAKNASAEELSIQEVNAGFYLVQKSALERCIQNLEKNSVSGEFYLTDIVEMLLKDQALVLGIPLEDSSEAMGINTQYEFAQVNSVLRNRVLLEHMANGVCFLDPSSVWVDAAVKIGKDVEIGAGVLLKGKSEIGDQVSISAYSCIENSQIGTGSKVHEFSHLKDSVLGPECEIGPYARLRPETVLDAKVKIGNFVEVKKSHFKEASKANHLSYVGDSEVGARSNIGAGTITCNYDGFRKSKTTLKDDVFVGSNSSLVAPVEIGKGSIIGAGSVITKNVPADSVAVERSKQSNLEGAAISFKEKRRK